MVSPIYSSLLQSETRKTRTIDDGMFLGLGWMFIDCCSPLSGTNSTEFDCFVPQNEAVEVKGLSCVGSSTAGKIPISRR